MGMRILSIAMLRGREKIRIISYTLEAEYKIKSSASISYDELNTIKVVLGS